MCDKKIKDRASLGVMKAQGTDIYISYLFTFSHDVAHDDVKTLFHWKVFIFASRCDLWWILARALNPFNLAIISLR